jgi:hypothetical protein
MTQPQKSETKAPAAVTPPAEPDMTAIIFSEPAEMYSRARGKGNGAQLRYRRFDTVAAAVQFAMEGVPQESVRSIDTSLGSLTEADIRRLYESDRYPFPRQAANSEG